MTMQENPLIVAAQGGPENLAARQNTPSEVASPQGNTRKPKKDRFDQIWSAAWKDYNPNASLSMSEIVFWQSAALTSQLYRLGGITEDAGKNIKQRLRAEYEESKKAEANLALVGTAMKLLNDSTVPEVQQVVKRVNDMFGGNIPWR